MVIFHSYVPSGDQIWQWQIHHLWMILPAVNLNAYYIITWDFPACHVWWHQRVHHHENLLNHHVPMVFLWFSLWFSYGFPRVTGGSHGKRSGGAAGLCVQVSAGAAAACAPTSPPATFPRPRVAKVADSVDFMGIIRVRSTTNINKRLYSMWLGNSC